jgi:hypothetical protein
VWSERRIAWEAWLGELGFGGRAGRAGWCYDNRVVGLLVIELLGQVAPVVYVYHSTRGVE